MVGISNLAVLAEGLRIGEKAGIDARKLMDHLAETGANSFQLQVRGPWIINNDFENRFGVSLALKDVRLGCVMADAFGYEPKFMKLAQKCYEAAEKARLRNGRLHRGL